MDSYEECRGPPRLFLLDKYGVLSFRTQIEDLLLYFVTFVIDI